MDFFGATVSQRSNFSMYLSMMQLALKPLMLVSGRLPGSTPPTDLSVTPIPNYVLEYSPLIWLHSQDPYRPSDIAQQLVHTTPMVNWTAVQDLPASVTLSNLDSLNEHGNTSVFLTSKEGIDADPQPGWLYGDTFDQNNNTGDAISSVVITRDHRNGTLDAFYFYFYAYNEGNTVLGMEFGNHIGDWEHNMIRFQNATPEAIWYSQHASGQAFTYDATEKQGKRPLGYSGNGTHATYSTPGNHDHTIPGLNLPAGFLVDKTDRGILWDPTKSAYAYSYEPATKTFQAYDPSFPVNLLYYNGQWGDDALPGGPELFGQKKWAAGPNGPKFKHLEREEVCPSHPCMILPFRSWDEGEGVSE